MRRPGRAEMACILDRTSWRGVCVDHPGEWEIALASGFGQPGRMAFADRRYHRLDVRWRKVRRTPNLALTLEKHRLNPAGELRDLSALSGLPQGWCGLLRKADVGCVTYAAKVFDEDRTLVEVALVWPERRDTALESTVLNSVALDERSATWLWQAMGISLDLPSTFELRTSDAAVGRVRWEFAAPQRRGPTISVERLAMPGAWLKGPLVDWLIEQLPPRQAVVRRQGGERNGHASHQVLSRGKAKLLDRIRGLRPMRWDEAWLCPTESRLYHVSTSRMSRLEDLDAPEGLVVRCCRAAPQVAATTGRRS